MRSPGEAVIVNMLTWRRVIRSDGRLNASAGSGRRIDMQTEIRTYSHFPVIGANMLSSLTKQ